MRPISPEVLDALDQSTCQGQTLRLAGALDRKLYTSVNKIIEAAGGRWNRKAGGHLFDGDACEEIDQIVLTGGVGPKQELGQFDTPAEVAERVIWLAEILPGMSVLEPSAGIGNLALPAIKAGGHVLTVEIDPRRCASLVLAVTKLATEQPSRAASMCMGLSGDFLAFEAAGQIGRFDRVAMNPPFARQADIDHVMAAARCLKPGGILVAVMSASIGFRTNTKTVRFRSWLAEHGGTVEKLPDGSFKSSGTGVSACIVKLRARSSA